MSDTLRERIAEACCLAENAPSWSWVPDRCRCQGFDPVEENNQ